MKFRVDCPCGDHIEIGEGSAGATFACSCGRPIVIPSLAELRTRAGLPANHISPEFVIEHLLLTPDALVGKTCAACGSGTDSVINVVTECERAVRVQSGGLSWPVFLFALFLFPPFLIWYAWSLFVYGDSSEVREYGRDKIYPLPLRVCVACRSKLNSSADIKKCLRAIPEYDLLLEKFPDAKVTLSS